LTWPVIATLFIVSVSASTYFCLTTRNNYQGELEYSSQTGWRLRNNQQLETLALKKVSFIGSRFLMITFKRQSKSLLTYPLSYVLTQKGLGESKFKQLKTLIVTGNCY
jgi:hypothetical protein